MSLLSQLPTCIGMLFWTSIVFAVTPVYQLIESETSAQPTVYKKAKLTHSIYRYSQQENLNDFVVIDSNGNKLPHRISMYQQESVKQTTLIPIKFFAVASGKTSEAVAAINNGSLHWNNNKIVINIEKSFPDTSITEASSSSAQPIDFFILDVSKVETSINTLIVDWQASALHQYVEIEVSGTNDLQNWSKLARSTLIKLEKEGETLIRNSVSLNLAKNSYKYLQLKCICGDKNLSITQILISNKREEPGSPVIDEWKISGFLAKDQFSAVRQQGTIKGIPVSAWEFVRDDIAPIHSFALDLGDNNYGDNIKIFSRNNMKQSWRLQHQGIWFNVQAGVEWKPSDAVSVYANTDKFWRVELNESFSKEALLKLAFKRSSEILEFIANNSPPYRIAINKKSATNNRSTSEQIFLRVIDDKEIVWTSVDLIDIASPNATGLNSTIPFDWKTLLFWSFLLAGLAVLLGVAIRLIKQMNPNDNP